VRPHCAAGALSVVGGLPDLPHAPDRIELAPLEVVPELGEDNVRELALYSYRILYKIRADDIVVLAVSCTNGTTLTRQISVVEALGKKTALHALQFEQLPLRRQRHFHYESRVVLVDFQLPELPVNNVQERMDRHAVSVYGLRFNRDTSLYLSHLLGLDAESETPLHIDPMHKCRGDLHSNRIATRKTRG
jgi:hypothetical protein